MKHVLNVGQCGFDHTSISSFLEQNFEAEVTPSATVKDALQRLREGGFDLVLVNRQFDADGSDGLEFIRQMKSDSELSSIPVMLVTNYQSYAEKAATLGAVPGFGKSELGSHDTIERLRPYL